MTHKSKLSILLIVLVVTVAIGVSLKTARDNQSSETRENTAFQPPQSLEPQKSVLPVAPNAKNRAPFLRVFSSTILEKDLSAAGETERRDLESLAANLLALGSSSNPQSIKLLDDFISSHEGSPITLSLLQEKAATEWKHGYFTASLESIRQAWKIGVDLKGPEQHRLADEAL